MKGSSYVFFRWVITPDGVTVMFGMVLILSQICFIFVVLASINIEGWTPDNVDKITSAIEHLATAAGIAVGGIWVYFRFFHERTYKPRLDLDLDAKLISSGQQQFVVATMKIKNSGLSQVNIDRDTSGLKIEGYKNQSLPTSEGINAVGLIPHERGVFEIFALHKFIEPNETIRDRVFFSVKKDEFQALKLEFRITGNVAKLLGSPKNLEWNDIYILSLVKESESVLKQLLTETFES